MSSPILVTQASNDKARKSVTYALTVLTSFDCPQTGLMSLMEWTAYGGMPLISLFTCTSDSWNNNKGTTPDGRKYPLFLGNDALGVTATALTAVLNLLKKRDTFEGLCSIRPGNVDGPPIMFDSELLTEWGTKDLLPRHEILTIRVTGLLYAMLMTKPALVPRFRELNGFSPIVSACKEEKCSAHLKMQFCDLLMSFQDDGDSIQALANLGVFAMIEDWSKLRRSKDKNVREFATYLLKDPFKDPLGVGDFPKVREQRDSLVCGASSSSCLILTILLLPRRARSFTLSSCPSPTN